MTKDSDGHARAVLPAAVVAPPGFEYFVAAVDEHGLAVAVFGSADAPLRVPVEPERPRLPEGPRARVRLTNEVVSFDGASGDDFMFLAEGDFLYRTELGPLYGVRVGYGHLRGRGAPLEVLDAGGPSELAAFTYGFFEIELALGRLVGVMGRVTAGLGHLDEPNVGQSGLRGGFQGRLRVGPERGTNLVLGAESIPEIGQRAFLGLSFEVLERWPMAAEVHVTDQPVASGDPGVRGVLEVGRRFREVATVAVRASFQGRRIDHSGFGAGLATTFDF